MHDIDYLQFSDGDRLKEWAENQIKNKSEIDHIEDELIKASKARAEAETKLNILKGAEKDNLEKITRIASDTALLNHVKNVAEKSTQLNQDENKLNISFKNSEQIINQINSNPVDYLKEKITHVNLLKASKSKELEKAIRLHFDSDIKGYKENLENSLLIWQKTFAKLFQDSSIDLLSLSGYHGKLNENAQALERSIKAVNEQFKKFQNILNKKEKGNLFEEYQQLQLCFNQASNQIGASKKNFSEFIFWLSARTDKEINLPFDYNEFDFSALDLRASNLNLIKNKNALNYQFEFADFTKTKVGQVSADKLDNSLKFIKKTLNIKKLGDIFTNYLDKENIKDWEKNIIKKAWQEAFPYFPILSEQTMYLDITYYIKKIEASLSKELSLQTELPNKMDNVDWSFTHLYGKIDAISLQSSLLPKDLRGVDLSGCDLSGTDLNGVIVDHTTKLSPTLTNLKGVIVKDKKAKAFKLADNLVIDGDLIGNTLPRDLRGIDLSGCTIKNFNLDDFIIKTTILNDVVFENVTFSHTEIHQASFNRCKFNRCHLMHHPELFIQGASFNHCEFNSVNMESNFISSTFLDCHFKSSYLGCEQKQTNHITVMAANFIGCTFYEDMLFEGIDLSKAQLQDCTFETLILFDKVSLPLKNISVSIEKLKDQHNFAEGSAFSDSNQVKISTLNAKQFMNQLNLVIQNAHAKSTDKLRDITLNWVRENIIRVTSGEEISLILKELNQWAQGEKGSASENKTDRKWRVFNHFYEHAQWYHKTNTKPSVRGLLLIDYVQKHEIKIRTEMIQEQARNQLTPEYQFFKKAFSIILSTREIENLNCNEDFKQVIYDICQGRNFFQLDIEDNYSKKVEKFRKDRGEISISEMLDIITALKKHSNYGRNVRDLSKLLVIFLTQLKPDLINEVLISFTPMELMRFYLTVGAFHEGFAEKFKTDNKAFKAMIDQITEANFVANVIFDTVLESSLDKLTREDQTYFIKLLEKSPYSNKAFFIEGEVDKHLAGSKANLFDHGKLMSDQNFDLLNEMLSIFHQDRVFYKLEDKAQFERVKKVFLSNFNNKKLIEGEITNQLKENNIDIKEAKIRAQAYLKEFNFGDKGKPQLIWPQSDITNYQGHQHVAKLKEDSNESKID